MEMNIASNVAKECFQPMVVAKVTALLEVSHIFRLKFANNVPLLVPLASIFTPITASLAKIKLLLSIAVNAKKNVQQDPYLIKDTAQMGSNANQLMAAESAPQQDSAMNVFLIIVVNPIANIKTQCLQHS
jgi:hypothetical protein